MAEQHHYALALDWIGAANGPVRGFKSYDRTYRITMDGKPPLTGSADPAFLGDPALYNPEDLLVAALSSCHFLSYLAMCARDRVMVTGYADRADGTMEFDGKSGRFLEVTLRPAVTVGAEADDAALDRAIALHEDAHHLCFIANSVNFPVRVEPEVARR